MNIENMTEAEIKEFEETHGCRLRRPGEKREESPPMFEPKNGKGVSNVIADLRRTVMVQDETMADQKETIMVQDEIMADQKETIKELKEALERLEEDYRLLQSSQPSAST